MSHDTIWGACKTALRQQAFFDSYRKTFRLIRADSDTQKEQAYRLRYDVYCEEHQFIDKTDYIDGQERDQFDDDAVHFLLIHKTTNEIAGTLRVILPQDTKPLTSFELQKKCDHPLLQIENRVMGMAEISRFCMAKKFRRRSRDGDLLPSYYEQEWNNEENKALSLPFFQRRIPYAPLGLLMMAFEAIMAHGIMNGVMMVEESQISTLQRLGLCYRVLGPRLSYHGDQQPLVFNIKAVMDSMKDINPECWDIVSDKGRLQKRADELNQYSWQDSLFDEACREMILRKLI